MAKRKKRKKNFLKDSYKESWNYIKDSRKYIYSIIIVFFIFSLIAYFLPVPQVVSERILELIQDIISKTEGMNFFDLFSYIFFNNLKVSFLSVLLGIFFGVIPVVFSITNGYILGFVASITTKEESILSLWRIFPHGIFELPAVFIAMALGLRLGLYIFLEKKMTFKKTLKHMAKVFVLVIIPLLFIAAFIETLLIFVSK